MRPGLAGWLIHSHYMEALSRINELHLDGGLASGLPLFLFHLLPLHSNDISKFMLQISSFPSISVIFPPICGQISGILSISVSFFSASGALELSDKCSGLNNRSRRSNVSSKFICQSRGQMKAMHFLRLPHHTPRGERPLRCSAADGSHLERIQLYAF